MTPDERDRLTRAETELTAMKSDLDEVKRDLKQVLATLSEARGSWKILVGVASVSASFGAVAAKLIPWLTLVK